MSCCSSSPKLRLHPLLPLSAVLCVSIFLSYPGLGCQSQAQARQVVEQCARVIGLLSRVRLDAVVVRFLRELTEAPEPGAPPRLRSDSHVARQELFQLCDGMKHVELAADHSRQVRSRSVQSNVQG